MGVIILFIMLLACLLAVIPIRDMGYSMWWSFGPAILIILSMGVLWLKGKREEKNYSGSITKW